jgi:hypothetical protein
LVRGSDRMGELMFEFFLGLGKYNIYVLFIDEMLSKLGKKIIEWYFFLNHTHFESSRKAEKKSKNKFLGKFAH